ncbi:glyoxalase superfamily protein [Aestuariispira ectoiniformans]|uniref:glyoxalase superfamily protein n=1 Tax=Aestuariispira ectoiniformans TaxID=2775080 RepID=UPI00223C52A6|nr:glyoxalase superfamily protein [Aestuariispira ectoiniformans]
MTGTLPTVDAVKKQAKELRSALEKDGQTVSHGHALELIAHQHGYRDWNTFRAAIDERPPETWTKGTRVTGHYLSQPIEAEIIAIEAIRPGWVRVTLDLDQPVDVVTFDSFSAYRKRVTGNIGPAGQSQERTSNGRPQLDLTLLD